MPLHQFQRGVEYDRKTILDGLAPYGYPEDHQRCVLLGPAGRPVIVLLSEENSRGYANARGDNGAVWMEFNRSKPDVNRRIRQANMLGDVGLFYRTAPPDRFTYLGPARYSTEESPFFILAFA